MRKCPKCEKKLSPMYFGTACKYCGADLMYYRFDDRLEQDARKAAAEEEKIKRLLGKLPVIGKRFRDEENDTREA